MAMQKEDGMWIADRWKDYELLDTGGGERLERWASYILRRPDPQVIWGRHGKDSLWDAANAVYHRSAKGGGHWEIRSLPEKWTVRYDDLSFFIQTFSFKHTGLFPEQAVNWDFMRQCITEAKAADPDRTVRVLNLFAYTGGATLACAAAGAEVVHVDASRGMIELAKENAAKSGLSHAKIRYLVDDCLKFVKREIRRGNHYDGIVLDPPSYGRGPKGEIWKLEENIAELLSELALLVSDRPVFFLLNSYTTGLSAGVLTCLLKEIMPSAGADIASEELGLPVTASGLVLPCGASGRMRF